MELTRKLTYPAPHRESFEVGGGKWHTRKWALQGVKQVRDYGGWFRDGGHDFDSKRTAAFAMSGKFPEQLRDEKLITLLEAALMDAPDSP